MYLGARQTGYRKRCAGRRRNRSYRCGPRRSSTGLTQGDTRLQGHMISQRKLTAKLAAEKILGGLSAWR